ncbi:hypothetical protein [Candidatus Nitrosocosmicus hydrocola]|uniref:hypothetical protein n=1 Tax=Candidatus Nitrosocosmicus hydrocola TaxID=1826872 RepID=UPI0011E5F5CF|nr:hypothetical protein [Candidatus Nitrosocosmicus hydrocola]
MTREYIYYYDDCIKDTLYSQGKLSHSELKRYIEQKFLKKEISADTFGYHVKKLIRDEVIFESSGSSYRRGEKKFYNLTEKTMQEMRLELSIKSLERKSNVIFKNYPDQFAVTYFLTLCTLATKGKWLITDNVAYEMGITIKEIREYYGGTFGFSPYYLKEENIAKVISLLVKENIIQRNVKSLNTDRFFVSDIELSNFINELIEIFQVYIFPRFFMYWRHIRSPRPKERMFFQIHYGNNVNQKITYLQETLKEKKTKSEYKKMSLDLKYKMYLWDSDLKEVFKEFFNKYSEVKKKHVAITNILLEIFYPEFLREEIKQRPKQYKYKKPLKILRINSNTQTKSKDQVDLSTIDTIKIL